MPDPETPDAGTTRLLVRAYGAALEPAAAAEVIVVDADRLPATKDELKKALLATLETEGDPRLGERLKLAYICLSKFQPGVGSEPVRLDLPADLSDTEDADTLREAAASLEGRLPEIRRWSAVATRERAELVEDLKRAGLWDPEA